ncbi:MAG: hypothetical protein K2G70_02310 [Turicibacter sp.]|nr:hypothetical protein [Turicibacter sp.]
MKISRTDLFWGVFLLIVGIGFLGEALNLWDFNLFFGGWWTLFIIVPCLVNMYESGLKRSNVIGVTVGILLLLSALQVLAEALVVPIFLVVIGLVLIFIRPRIDK